MRESEEHCGGTMSQREMEIIFTNRCVWGRLDRALSSLVRWKVQVQGVPAQGREVITR